MANEGLDLYSFSGVPSDMRQTMNVAPWPAHCPGPAPATELPGDEAAAPGGTLLVGNFSLETHPNDRVLIDWLLDWQLLYRNEADYRAIFARTSFDQAHLYFEFEPLRANLFAVAHR